MTATMSRRRSAAVGPATAAMLLLAGCASGGKPAPSVSVVDKVTVVTGFNVTGQDAWLYVGIDRGFFREAGLDVTVAPGAGTGTNLKVLHAGQASFAVIDMTGGLLERQAGQTDFRVIGTIYQRSVSCIMALQSRGITTPKDLEGKRVGYTPGGVNYTLFPSYARLAGVDASAVRWVALPPAQLRPALVAGQLDAITEVVIGAPAVRVLAGQPVTVLPYSDVLGDLYGNVLATSVATASGRVDLVRRFQGAMLRALAYTIVNPDEAGALLHSHQPAYPAAAAAAEVRAAEPYVRSGLGIGAIEERRVMQTIALLQASGAVAAGTRPTDVVAFDLVPNATPTPAR